MFSPHSIAIDAAIAAVRALFWFGDHASVGGAVLLWAAGNVLGVLGLAWIMRRL